ncbi:MAG: YybS family protein [Synergistetes bacterium]|nr:YybS family protein [Synergistota bacterium]
MRSRDLVEVSLLSAISAVLFLSSIFIPIVGVIIALFCPVPIVVLGIKHGLKRGLTGTIITSVIVGLLSGPFQALWVFMGFGFVGLGIGVLVAKGKSAIEVLIYGSMISLASKIVLVLLSLALFGVNPFSIDVKQMEHALTSALSVAGSSADVKLMISRWLTILQIAIPAIFFLASVIDTFLAYVVSCKVLKKMHISMPQLLPFELWVLPRSMFWGFVAGVLFMWLGKGDVGSIWYRIGVNVQIVFSIAFMISGMSILYFWLKKIRVPKIVAWIIVIVTILQPFLSQLLVFLGIFDLWVDFRKIRKGAG